MDKIYRIFLKIFTEIVTVFKTPLLKVESFLALSEWLSRLILLCCSEGDVSFCHVTSLEEFHEFIELASDLKGKAVSPNAVLVLASQSSAMCEFSLSSLTQFRVEHDDPYPGMFTYLWWELRKRYCDLNGRIEIEKWDMKSCSRSLPVSQLEFRGHCSGICWHKMPWKIWWAVSFVKVRKDGIWCVCYIGNEGSL